MVDSETLELLNTIKLFTVQLMHTNYIKLLNYEY
jgi:hypothetical protein